MEEKFLSEESSGFCVILPYRSTTAQEVGLRQEVVRSSAQLDAWVLDNKSCGYFMVDVRWPVALGSISIPRVSICDDASGKVRVAFLETLIENVKRARCSPTTRINQAELGALLRSGSLDRQELQETKASLLNDHDTVLLCFDSRDSKHHPMMLSRFPKLFMFSEKLKEEGVRLEEYMCGYAFLEAILRQRVQRRQTTRVWLVGSVAKIFLPALPLGVASFTHSRMCDIATDLKEDDALRIECLRLVMGDQYYPIPDARPEHSSGLSPLHLGLKGSGYDQSFFDCLDAAVSSLIRLDKEVDVQFPVDYPADFMQDDDGQPPLTLLQWILIRVLSKADSKTNLWNEPRVQRALNICKRIERDAIAYDMSAKARKSRPALPSMLEVRFATTAEGFETMEKIKSKIKATGMRGPWRRESLWPLKTRPMQPPSQFVLTFNNERRLQDETEPGLGHKASFIRSHYLSGQHVRALFEDSKEAFSQWAGSPVLYGVLRNHFVRGP
jgi:hypothetical protein